MPTIEETIEFVKKALPGERLNGTPIANHSIRIYESLKKFWFSEDVFFIKCETFSNICRDILKLCE